MSGTIKEKLYHRYATVSHWWSNGEGGTVMSMEDFSDACDEIEQAIREGIVEYITREADRNGWSSMATIKYYIRTAPPKEPK